MVNQDQYDLGDTYCIRVNGTILNSIVASFGDVTIMKKDDNETMLIGKFIDQPALRGFIDHLWNLNLTILSVQRIKK